jgi:uncharacterized protein
MSTYSNPNNKYTIEVTPTQACNFNCTYCFEHGTNLKENILQKNMDLVISQIENIFNDPWFDKSFENKNISLWGGEPSLDISFIEKVVSHFLYDKDVTFFIYTNGSRIKELMPILLKCKDVEAIDEKFKVQISYDGKYLQNLKRKLAFKSKKTSSDIVLEGIELLHKNEIDFGLKSTITYEDFNQLEGMWNEFLYLYDNFNTRLSLTVDYHKIEFLKYKEMIEQNLIQVAKKEIEFYRKHGIFLSNIFSGKRMFCGCGKGMTAINTDGKLYYCHGCFYSDKIPEVGTIFDSDVPDKIKKNYNYFYNIQKPNDECSRCVALTCLKCNVKKYENSNESLFYDRWHDYTNQPELCEYYKMCGRIGRAILNIIEEEK